MVVVGDFDVDYLHSYGELLFLSSLYLSACFLVRVPHHCMREGCLGEWVTFVLPDAHSPSLA